MDNPSYYLSVRWKGVASSVSINEVPLAVDVAGDGIVMEQPIDSWLMPAENQLGIHLQWPRGVAYEPNKASGEVEVFIHDPAQEVPTPLVTLSRFEWPVPSTPEFYPFTVRLPLKIERPPETELWRRAQIVRELTDDDRAAIESLVDRLGEACARRDPAAAFSVQEYKWRDLARAERKDYERVRQSGVGQLDWLLGQPGLKAVEGDRPLQMDLLAGGRVVSVTRLSGQSPVMLADDQSSIYEIPVFASRLEGQWMLVR